MATRRLSPIERVLRALVRLLPAGFRYDFGAAIDADLADRRTAGDRAGLLARDLPSLLAAVVREHASALRQDVAYALRMMRRTPGFTAMAVLMLALGTGVNVAMFSIVDAVLLRSPFGEPDRIVEVLDTVDRRIPTASVPIERFRALAATPGNFKVVAGFVGSGSHVTTAMGTPRRLDSECVSAAMFDVLGTPPLLGRRFNATDDRPDAEPVIVLSYGFWKRLGGSPSILGSTIVVNQTPIPVVGVMPRFFAGPLSRSDTEAWLPMHRPVIGAGSSGCPSNAANSSVYARLHDGVTIEQARRALSGFQLRPLTERLDDVSRGFTPLAAAVLCVLLIACFNVGGLQMERTLARRREIAVRLALGASRARLARQVLTENVVLAFTGAAAGAATAWFSLRAIVSLMPGSTPYVEEIEINARVLVATLVAASAAGLVAGLMPLMQARHLNPAADLAGGTRSSERRGSRTRRSLVIVEVALSVAMLIGSALTIQSFLALRPTQPGFDPARKVSVILSLQGDAPEARQRFVLDLFDRLRTAPGVRALAASTYLPLRGNSREVPVVFAGTTAEINTGYITPGFIELMKIPVRAGRTFTVDDRAQSVPVAIVDERFAKRIRPDGRVLGERIGVILSSRPKDPPVDRLIVGIVGSTRSYGGSILHHPIAYMPYAQDPINFVLVVAESDGRPELAVGAEIRSAMSALRPNLAPGDADPMVAMLDRSISHWRFGASLLGVFAALAVLLAAIGLMTTIGWWVRQRTRELGVRLALGATRGEITRLVCVQGLLLAGTGIAVGCLAAAGATRYLRGWIYGVTPLDPATFAGGAAAMLVVAAAAIFVPVRCATSVDPAVVLKTE